MLQTIKRNLQKSEKHRSLYLIIKKIKHYYGKTLIFNMRMFLRYIGISNFHYKNLKKLKNTNENQRCFIIATGPSLTIEDLNKVRDEKTFGMNSLCKIYGEIGWETTYYGIQDTYVYEKLKGDIASIKKSTIIIGDSIKDSWEDYQKKWCSYPLNMLNHLVTYEDLTADFSENSYMKVYDGYTITYSLIQIAVYMGFKEIVLMGCDCNYSDNKDNQHFVSSGVFDSTYKTAGKRMMFAYEKAKEFADANNIMIYNATRGGMLEVFPRVDLDEILNLKVNK
ncbi:6-hydroxymethylpterin diphosphokinase MptE-like protein [Paenibacillus sp. FSL R7-0179]|uniref:6-hydroxymethylpterin diphosphokinase MptE-like protein n=1 Tax=Paenibacillus sp. FSL R7-0179 TaxID=2921672 RepID=UPI0030FA4005